MFTQAPPEERSIFELLFELLEALNGIRTDLNHPIAKDIRPQCQGWSADTWMTDVINSAFNATVCGVVGNKVVIKVDYLELAMKHLGDGRGSTLAADPTRRSFILNDSFAEILRREREEHIIELGRYYALNIDALACVTLSNQELLDKFEAALGACDPGAIMQLIDPQHDPSWFLKFNFEALGAKHVRFNTPMDLMGFEQVSPELFRTIEHQFGIPDQSPREDYIRLQPWVRMLLTRINRDELTEAFTA